VAKNSSKTAFPRKSERLTLSPCGVLSVNWGAGVPAASKAVLRAGLAADAGLSSQIPTPGSLDGLKPTASAAWTSSADAFPSEAEGEAAGGGVLEDERMARTPATIAIAAPTVAVPSQIHLDDPDR
jgi:hypothetical protein